MFLAKFLVLALVPIALAKNGKQEPEVLVNLPTLGTIKGRQHQTVGGRSYFNFRNIPFGESTAGANRFKVMARLLFYI